MPLSSLRLAAKQVHVGVYQLSPTLIEQINDWKTLMPSPVPAALEQQGYRPSGSHFFSGDPLKPKVGDLRISFRYAGRTGMPVSVVARQMHGALQAFPTRAGDMLEMLTPGVVSKEQMFASAKAVNTATTWAVRVGGWLGMWLGFALVANIISTLGQFKHALMAALPALPRPCTAHCSPSYRCSSPKSVLDPDCQSPGQHGHLSVHLHPGHHPQPRHHCPRLDQVCWPHVKHILPPPPPTPAYEDQFTPLPPSVTAPSSASVCWRQQPSLLCSASGVAARSAARSEIDRDGVMQKAILPY